MSGHDARDRLAVRLGDAYGLSASDARAAVASLEIDVVASGHVAFERHGNDVLLVDGGEVIATLVLGDLLPAIAPACDTLDPHGDREDGPLRQVPSGRYMA
jgi:hypothetical protein